MGLIWHGCMSSSTPFRSLFSVRFGVVTEPHFDLVGIRKTWRMTTAKALPFTLNRKRVAGERSYCAGYDTKHCSSSSQ